MKTKIRDNVKWVAAPSLLALSMGANAGFVDTFETNQGVADNQNTAVSSFVTGPGILNNPTNLNGERDMSVQAISGGIEGGGAVGCDVILDQCSRLTVVADELRFANDPGVTGQGTVQWDGPDASMTFDKDGLNGLDLTEGGTLNAFQFTILQSDLNWVFTLEVASDANNWTKVEIEATPVAAGSPVERLIYFAALENALLCNNPGATGDPQILSVTCGGGGGNQPVDFTDFGGMEIVLNTPAPFDIPDNCDPGDTGVVTPECLPEGQRQAAVDLRLEAISTVVPEPSLFGMMGIGLLAFAGATRRRKQQG